MAGLGTGASDSTSSADAITKNFQDEVGHQILNTEEDEALDREERKQLLQEHLKADIDGGLSILDRVVTTVRDMMGCGKRRRNVDGSINIGTDVRGELQEEKRESIFTMKVPQPMLTLREMD